MKKILALVCVLPCLTALPAAAQNFSGPLSPGAAESTLGTGPIAQALNGQQGQAPAAVDFTYKADPAQRARTLKAVVDSARQADPNGAAELEKLFASPEFFPMLEKEMGRFGLRTDNVADVYTIWWIGLWQASRGLSNDPTPASIQAVKGQASRALSTTPAMANADNAAKQELAETLLIRAMLTGAAVEAAKANPEQMKAVSAMALKGGQEAGLDLTKMNLTDHGFSQ